MAVAFSSIKTQVQEKGDGRSFTETQMADWANVFRKDVAMDFLTSGFHGFYFLYKEASVKDGSVLDQPNYAIPDDFIDDLNVFYDGVLLGKEPPGLLEISQGRESAGTIASGSPQWVELRGVEFFLRPAPDEAGNTIYLLYNGLPDDIPLTGNDNSTDYFMNHFPKLHIYGMAEPMAESIGLTDLAKYYSQKKDIELAKLRLHNRRHYLKGARLRFMNWSEFQDIKRIVFPQLVET